MSYMNDDSKTYELIGGKIHVKSSYDEDVVNTMRELGLSHYWDQEERAYVIPEKYFLDSIRLHLERMGFEAN